MEDTTLILLVVVVSQLLMVVVVEVLLKQEDKIQSMEEMGEDFQLLLVVMGNLVVLLDIMQVVEQEYVGEGLSEGK